MTVQALLRGFATACLGSSIFGPLQAPQLAPLDSCPRPELSCHSSSENTCCTLAPGGQILQTQFWDTSPATGPSDSWTIHGLWPNYCDRGFPESCDPGRAYNVRSTLKEFGAHDLIEYMQTYWLPDNRHVDRFWDHEWSKHGTCVSTMNPECYGDNYRRGEEVPVYFRKTIELFQGLNTYQALAAAGITPSQSQRYSLQEVEAALASATGFGATVLCQEGQLRQVFYHFNVVGTLQEGRFVQIDPVSNEGNCPSSVQYLPKT